MNKRSLVAFSLILVIVGIACVGCDFPDSPRIIQARQDFAAWEARMIPLQQDIEKNKQDIKNCLAELEDILGQETSLLETLGNDEQIQPADFQLYKDFLLFIQKSDDQIKTYEFIEKMRAVLPADKMETIENLYHQLKQNMSKYDNLQKQREVLKERVYELLRQKQEITQRWN